MLSLLSDSEEYLRRLKTPYTVPKCTLAQVRDAVPKHLYHKSTLKALCYVARDIACAFATYIFATRIDGFSASLTLKIGLSAATGTALKWALWATYWHCQGIIFAGIWCMGHEAGHGTLSDYSVINHVIGFVLHTSLLAPYYNWRATHHAHHKAAGSIERDENYVPRTRTDYNLPPAAIAHISDYHDIFEETPIYTLFCMAKMQLFGWHYYLLTNAMGSTMHKGKANVNHFSPSSPLFRPKDHGYIVVSDIGIVGMMLLLGYYAKATSLGDLFRSYLIPYLLSNHWIVMLTYLHHSSPDIPHFRGSEWSFLRGAVSTVDRPLLGWAGRFFLHNVSHDHVAHHFFSSIPFYNQPEVTKHIKTVLKDDYNYDSTNSFRSLYRTFTQCRFIEDSGDIVFYRNKDGVALREMAN